MLDAMYDRVMEQVEEMKRLWQNKRQLAFQGLNLGLVIVTALMIWRTAVWVTKGESPVVVVLSGSMEPAMYRGDLLLLSNTKPVLTAGEIVVFKIDGREIPVVHRILEARQTDDGSYKYLTKGDNNKVYDHGLYAPGQKWLERRHIVGHVEGYIPYAGSATILMNDYPWLKFCVVGIMALIVLTGKEK